MLQIGSAWGKTNAESGKYSISIALTDEVLELYPNLQNMFLNLYENKNKTEDKQPDFYLYLSLPKKEDKKET